MADLIKGGSFVLETRRPEAEFINCGPGFDGQED